MDSAYYREYYELERNHWWFLARAEIIRTQVQKLADGKILNILNIGTATGQGTELLSEFGKVTSLEYDSDCVKFLSEQLKMDVIQGSILELPFSDNEFDLVCAFDVIEHVEDDQLAAREMLRVCRKGGFVFCTVPAYRFLWSEHDNVNHHKRRYTSVQFKKLFAEAHEHYSTYFNSILFLPVSAFRIISRILPARFMRKGAGSDFTVTGNKTLNSFFYKIFRSENNWLKKNRSLPFGISFLYIAKNIP